MFYIKMCHLFKKFRTTYNTIKLYYTQKSRYFHFSIRGKNRFFPFLASEDKTEFFHFSIRGKNRFFHFSIRGKTFSCIRFFLASLNHTNREFFRHKNLGPDKLKIRFFLASLNQANRDLFRHKSLRLNKLKIRLFSIPKTGKSRIFQAPKQFI